VTEEQAVNLANTFVNEQMGTDPRIDGDRYIYSLLKVRVGKNKEWRIVYTLEFPDRPERIWDGPVVVVVDPVTGDTSFFD
jgi:hypothetical protein